ncbi:hypothetical protein K7432_002923 [Basidiobolus ranarum]|uniref:RING-type E3 ubiquitin transferase n=1 Tax=Basidiobolus ranarum TaxID=34480 RepID=A0ABR2X0P2_9FUNG
MYLTNVTTTGWSNRHRLFAFCLLLICFHFQLTSAGLFGGKNPSIRQETVYMDTSTNHINPDKVTAPNEITSSVRSVPNTSSLYDKNLEGIGFIIDVPCVGPPRPSSMSTSQRLPYFRIALVALKNCSLDWQVIYAQNSQAQGAIIYSESGDIDLDHVHFSIPIVIPVFVVGSEKGHQMAQDIIDTQQQQHAGVSNILKKQIRFKMQPSERTLPSVWEFTLIIVVVLLFLSLAISVAMHCHLYRLRRNYALRNNIPDSTEMMVIHKSGLDRFPIKVWHPKGDLHALSSHGKIENSQHCALVMEPPPAYDPQNMLPPPPFKSEDEESAQSVCPICLDDFIIGDEIRELPCCHHYHVECIDPWLTTKSGTCPMCKLAISSDLTPAYLPPEHSSWWYSIGATIFAPCMIICR